MEVTSLTMNNHHCLYMDTGDLQVASDPEAWVQIAAVVEVVVEEMVENKEKQLQDHLVLLLTIHHPEAVSDNWYKREPDSCTYTYNKTPGLTVPIPPSLEFIFTDDV